MNKTAFGGLVFSIMVISGLTLFSNVSETSAIHRDDDPITAELKAKIERDSPILDNRKISDGTYDYIISADAQIRHIRAGDVMRIAGTTIDGFSYYAIQMYDHKGQISTTGTMIIENKPYSISHVIEEFIPIPTQQQEIIPEVIEETIPVKAVILSPHTTYWRQDMVINVKAFEQDSNTKNDYWYKNNLVPNIPVVIDINHENGKHLTTIHGITDANGYFQATHYITENIVQGGKYLVDILVGDTHKQTVSTFVTPIVTQNVGNNNKSPVANAGPNQNVVHPVNVILDGTASFDPEGDPITSYLWSQVSGPAVVINNAGTDTANFNTAGAGTYVIQLTVTAGGKSGSDQVTITVT